MMSANPIYLCGLYEERLRCLQAILRSTSSYIGSSEIKLMKEVLDIDSISSLQTAPQSPAIDRTEIPPPVEP